MFIKWLKRRQKSELKQEPQSQPASEPKSKRTPRPITSMMGPEPGAIIGGKRRKPASR